MNMRKLTFGLILAGAVVLPAVLTVCCSGGGSRTLPCDIYRKNGTPCVTAHSTTRLLASDYKGPLYQVRRESDGRLLDITATVQGYANAAMQDEFCKGTVCVITQIYDQSGMGNDLLQAPPGTFNGPDKGYYNELSIADMAPVMIDGHKAYGVYIMPGMGYRCNQARGLAINDEPEGMYYVIDGTHYDSGCCFDYGNSSTNGRAVGTGTMETTYFGTATAWGSGNGNGPWIMSDMESGLFSGYSPKKNDVPTIDSWPFVSVFVNGGGGNRWDLRGADASWDSLITFYSGVRPGSPDNDSYFPMHKKGAMLLGNGGDNGNGSAGTFYEGVMTVGYPTDKAVNAVQRNIARTAYSKYPLSVSRPATFQPGERKTLQASVSEDVTALSADLPEGWRLDACDRSAGGYQIAVTAPSKRSAGYATVRAQTGNGEVTVAVPLRCAEPVRINEIQLANATNPQFIELYSNKETDLSGLQLVARRSGWAPLTIATIPAGTKIDAGGFYTLALAPNAVTVSAAKGASEISLLNHAEKGSRININGKDYRVMSDGVPAGAQTTIFIPVSEGYKLSFANGDFVLPVTSNAGFEPGQLMGIDLGGSYEVATVKSVGTAALQTVVSTESKAGDTTLSLESTEGLEPGSLLKIDTGDRLEEVTVASIVKASTLPAGRRIGQGRPDDAGIIALKEPLKAGHIAKVDAWCTGTGITFSPAFRSTHMSGDAIQPLGMPYTISPALESDVRVMDPVLKDKPQFDQYYGYSLSETAGSIALIDAETGVVIDAVVYGSQQSSSSANGTIASPELAVLEGDQSGGGSIAVVPQAPRRFGSREPLLAPRSLVRFPDGNDTDNLSRDFRTSDNPTPGAKNN